MGIKEIYEEMSDEELLERFKNFKDYREDGKKAIIEELRKRNLVREEEIEKISVSENRNIENENAVKYKNKKYKFIKYFIIIYLLGGVIRIAVPLLFTSKGNTAYYSEKNYHKAEKLYRISEKINDGYPINLSLLGMTLFTERKYKESLEPLLKAKNIYDKRNEKNIFVLKYLALTYLYLENYGEFNKVYLEAINSMSESKEKSSLNHSISLYYLEIGDYTEGLKYIDNAIKLEPDNADFYYFQGNIYFELKEFDKAIESFLNNIKNRKEVVDDVYFKLSILYKNKNNFSKSIDYLDLYINNYDKDKLELYYLYAIKADLLKNMGDLNGSKEYADKVINVSKNEISNKELYKKALEIIKSKKEMEK